MAIYNFAPPAAPSGNFGALGGSEFIVEGFGFTLKFLAN
jgi:hypothetical protein